MSGEERRYTGRGDGPRGGPVTSWVTVSAFVAGYVEDVTREMVSHAGGGNQSKLIYLLVFWLHSKVQRAGFEKLVPCESKSRSPAASDGWYR